MKTGIDIIKYPRVTKSSPPMMKPPWCLWNNSNRVACDHTTKHRHMQTIISSANKLQLIPFNLDFYLNVIATFIPLILNLTNLSDIIPNGRVEKRYVRAMINSVKPT